MKHNGNCRKSRFFFRVGLLLIIGSVCLSLYNLWDDARAAAQVDAALKLLEKEISDISITVENGIQIPDYVLNPAMDMPIEEIDGIEYIGILDIPTMGVSLPVISQWSYPNLKVGPCRYNGTTYSGNFVIAAHNYTKHFGKLVQLEVGDFIMFTDVDGNEFHYIVVETETLSPSAVDEMISYEWDLTLFTCTFGGQSRVTVRCDKIDS